MDERTRRLTDRMVARVERFYQIMRIVRWIAFVILLFVMAWIIYRTL